MKIYKVKVNGKTYKVELESIDTVKSETSAAPEAAEKPAAQPEPKAPSAEGQKVLSPIQGTVVAVKVKPGDKVKKGSVLLLIEAMKLENEVVSPYDGEVAEVLVTKGQGVKSKDVLVVIS